MRFIDHLLQPTMTGHCAIPLITCRTPRPKTWGSPVTKSAGHLRSQGCWTGPPAELQMVFPRLKLGSHGQYALVLSVVSKAILVERCTEKRAKDVVDALQESLGLRNSGRPANSLENKQLEAQKPNSGTLGNYDLHGFTRAAEFQLHIFLGTPNFTCLH